MTFIWFSRCELYTYFDDSFRSLHHCLQEIMRYEADTKENNCLLSMSTSASQAVANIRTDSVLSECVEQTMPDFSCAQSVVRATSVNGLVRDRSYS